MVAVEHGGRVAELIGRLVKSSHAPSLTFCAVQFAAEFGIPDCFDCGLFVGRRRMSMIAPMNRRCHHCDEHEIPVPSYRLTKLPLDSPIAMMRRLSLLFFSFVLGHAASTSTAGIGGTPPLAGIRLPRGGSTSSMSQFLEEQAAVDASSVVHPPLSAEEIGDSLRDVPLYYIERKDTGGILVAGSAEEGKSTRTSAASAARPTDRDSGRRTRQRQQPTTRRQNACYFFLEKEAAQANLEQVVRGDNNQNDGGRQGQTQQQLQISTTRLSQLHEKFWPKNNNNKQDEMDDEVDFRLVAIHQELLRARFLLTVTERDVRRQLSDE